MRFFFLFLICMIVMPVFVHADEMKPLRVCYYNHEELPFYRGDGDEVPPVGQRGDVVEMVHTATKRAGIPVEWLRRPWLRCLSMVENGTADAVFNAAATPEREAYMAYPRDASGVLDPDRSIVRLGYHFYANVYNPVKWDGQRFDRDRIKIGSPRGYVVTDKLYEKGFRAVQEMKPSEGFQQVLDQTLDVYAMTPLSAKSILTQLPQADIRLKRLDPAVYVDYLYDPVRQDYYDQYPEAIEVFWREIADLSKAYLAGDYKP